MHPPRRNRSTGSPRRSWRAAARVAVVLLPALLTGLAVPTGPAVAAPPSPGASATSGTANSGETPAQLHQEVRAGRLLQAHGVHEACPQCQAQIVTKAPGDSTPLRSTVPAG